MQLPPVSDFQSTTGEGVRGIVEGKEVRVGKLSFLGLDQAEIKWFEKQQKEWDEVQKSLLFASIDGKAGGMISVSDPIKDSTPRAVEALHQLGKRLIMLSGDNAKTAEAIANKLKIDEWKAGVGPKDKQDYVKRVLHGKRLTAMAGDGINDAPALAAADVGIAMGTGTDAAMESADVTLIKGDLMGILQAIRLSRAMMRNIRQNLFFAFIYNFTGIFIAAGILYPWTGLLLNPMVAALAMSFSSLSVVGNALRLRRIDI